MKTSDWAGASGDRWADRWQDTDRVFAPVAAALDHAIVAAAPPGAFKAIDVGCGPGTTALSLARRRGDASILGCDVSSTLIALARQRAKEFPAIRFVEQDAEEAAREHGPFDLIYSRHGVMFFDDPRRAFAVMRSAACDEAALVFSCFAAWADNPWAAELASAVAGQRVPAPGRDPGPFAFSDPEYVHGVLAAAGWADVQPRKVPFDYVAGEGAEAVEEALGLLSAIGPAARALQAIAPAGQGAAVARMRAVVTSHWLDATVAFPAAAWIWTARAK
jgi:SAM-dependent methyltransferase